MLSYLQDKRPKRRRSANLLSAFLGSSDNDSARERTDTRPTEASTSSRSRRGSTKDAPTSPRGHGFPQVPRVASSYGKSMEREDEGRRQHWSFKGDDLHSSRPVTSASIARPPFSSSATLTAPIQPSSVSPLDSRRSSLNRNRRPIDLRFDQMRAYSTTPFYQSVYDQPVQPHIISQPTNPPTPPPKTAPTTSRSSTEPMENTTSLPLSRPSTRRSRWENKTDRAPRAPGPSTQETANQEAPLSQQRYSKAKLNLMNPISLISRRRSHKPAERLVPEQQTPAPKLPDDYDPRIRGKVVHDFSAPRSSRPQTSRAEQDFPMETIKIVPGETSPEKEHTPVFKEEFDDGLENSQDPATRTEAFTRMAAAQASQPDPDTVKLPAFAKKLPSKIGPEKPASKPTSRRTSGGLDILVEPPDQDQSLSLPSPSASPPRANSTSASISETTISGLGSPKRYKSDASRFSFDLAGVGSAAQEKLLEDKHREKAQRQARQSVMSAGSAYEDDDHLVDIDDMDNGIEERIPGVNCDDEDDVENNMPVLRRDMEGFQVASPNKSSFDSTASPVSTGVTSLDTPFLGVPYASAAASKSSPNLILPLGGETQASDDFMGLGRPRSNPDTSQDVPSKVHAPMPAMHSHDALRRGSISDDDMYFDDGMIDEIGDVSELDEFDENVFDDTGHSLYGLPLRDRTLKPKDESYLNTDNEATQGEGEAKEDLTKGNGRLRQSKSNDGISVELRDALTDLGHPNMPVFTKDAGLTHDNLAAYDRNSLLSSMNQAATTSESQSAGMQSHPAQQPDLMVSAPRDDLPGDMFSFGDDAFDSDGLDDDDIVAAANAEALENDDDGFYGQEFGFFARASKGEEGDELVNGGYFGARGINEGIKRSHSGKADFQEPSLTPITERSEFSNRNSTISLAQLHGHAFAAPNPSLDMRLDDVNMQLAMLKQLRKGAWGGSDASLHSSSASQHSGSPVTYVSPHGFPMSNSASNLQNMSSLQSMSSGRPSSNDSGASPETDSPTLTLPLQQQPAVPSMTQPLTTGRRGSGSMPPPLIPASAMKAPVLSQPAKRPTLRSGVQGKGHSRHSSGGESISYKEEGGKWIMEKRRMSETGETMMVGRSVIEAGSI